MRERRSVPLALETSKGVGDSRSVKIDRTLLWIDSSKFINSSDRDRFLEIDLNRSNLNDFLFDFTAFESAKIE